MRTLIVLCFSVSGIIFLTNHDAYCQDIKTDALLTKVDEAMNFKVYPRSIQKFGKGHSYFIEQSQRPNGPFAVNYFTFSATILPEKGKGQHVLNIQIQPGRFLPMKFIIDGEISGLKFGSNYRPLKEGIDEELYLSPEYIITSAKLGHAKYLKDSLVEGVPHSIISFTWKQFPVRLFVNLNSYLPGRIEIIRHYIDDVPYLWGDIKKIIQYSFWELVDKKVHYPFQKDIFIGGKHWQSFTLDSVKLDLPVSTDSLSIPDSAKISLQKSYKALNPFNEPEVESKEIYNGIHFIQGKSGQLGSYNCSFINTNSGIIVLEAPVTSGYSKSVINEIKRLYPDKKIAGVITTSDAWPHVGGIREYVAQKIPVYLLDLNVTLINKLLKANYYTNTDSYQLRKIPADLRKILMKTVIGSGDERIEIYPVRTETGERMMMVYFPKYKLLYTSDLIQSAKKLSPMLLQYLSEIDGAVKREKLDPETVFGMHLPPTNYSSIINELE